MISQKVDIVDEGELMSGNDVVLQQGGLLVII